MPPVDEAREIGVAIESANRRVLSALNRVSCRLVAAVVAGHVLAVFVRLASVPTEARNR